MLYMVECGFADAANEAAWNEWYSGPKLSDLLSAEDFLSAQRFRALDNEPAPYLNLTSLRSASMFNSTDYRSAGGGGFGPWDASLITDWTRRLFSGIDQFPAVTDAQYLLFVDSPTRASDWPGPSLTWLEGEDWQQRAGYRDGVALDKSVSYRGFAIASETEHAQLQSWRPVNRDSERVRWFVPICPFRDE